MRRASFTEAEANALEQRAALRGLHPAYHLARDGAVEIELQGKHYSTLEEALDVLDALPVIGTPPPFVQQALTPEEQQRLDEIRYAQSAEAVLNHNPYE